MRAHITRGKTVVAGAEVNNIQVPVVIKHQNFLEKEFNIFFIILFLRKLHNNQFY
jgi:hypothetical protein